MGYAAHRAWFNGLSPFNSQDTLVTARHASTVYSVQLALNLIWTPIFFGLKKPIPASIDIVALLGTNVYLTYLYSQFDTGAAWCMAPYLGWLSFATYLCIGVGYLNGWELKAKEPKNE